MKQALIDIIKTRGYPYYLQGTLSADTAYPDSFYTFWNNEARDGDHYDNDAIFYVWDFTVYFFSTNPELVNTELLALKALLKSNGWIVGGKGYDVPSDEATHTGRAIDALFIEH